MSRVESSNRRALQLQCEAADGINWTLQPRGMVAITVNQTGAIGLVVTVWIRHSLTSHKQNGAFFIRQ